MVFQDDLGGIDIDEVEAAFQAPFDIWLSENKEALKEQYDNYAFETKQIGIEEPEDFKVWAEEEFKYAE
jgi:hypothetical protein